MFTAPNVPVQHVKSGKLRLLAVTTRERVPGMADTPTVAESGVKEFEYLGWIVLFAPANTPRAAIETLQAAWAKARTTSAVRNKLDELAMSAPERYGNRESLVQYVRSEHTRLGKIIRDAGIENVG